MDFDIAFTCSGEKLRRLLEKHGDFKRMELAVSRWFKRTRNDGTKGKWVTKEMLKTQHHYSKNPGDQCTFSHLICIRDSI